MAQGEYCSRECRDDRQLVCKTCKSRFKGKDEDYCSKACQEKDAQKGSVGEGVALMDNNIEQAVSFHTVVSLEDAFQPPLPPHSVRIRLDGPHGAPSELVWKHSVVMLVGAGIGVTPFASVLRSIQLRTKSREGRRKSSKELDWQPCQQVYFYWLCRGQEEFNWFHGLLSRAVDGPAKDRMEINLFQTGTVELSEVKELGGGFRQFLGRPNWGRIFPGVADKHPGEDVGVFLCGPQAIRMELQKHAGTATQKNTKNTRFMVHAENF